jgi:hypothetical protein
MAKKNGKKITIDGLAIIINKGFDGQMAYMEKRFDQFDQKMASKEDVKSLDTRLNTIEKDVKYIKENLTSAVELEKDVEYIKNTLNIPALKK